MKEDPISQMYKCRSFKVTQTKKKILMKKKIIYLHLKHFCDQTDYVDLSY